MIQSFDLASLGSFYADGGKPEDVVREVYARIRSQGERPVWISVVPEEAASERARTAPKGPLYGIPFAIKDNIDVAGLPTTCACPDFSYMPKRSAFVVEQLEAAGALVIGKTNMDQFATGLNGTRSPYGIPRSVFNSEYISGGSSSGSAVAVASGLVSFALGTDTAGSGRVPAAFNNIVGWKPTKGVISTRGVVPACRTQDTVSIFALSVHDAAAVARVASAFDTLDPFSRRSTLTYAAPKKKLRLGVLKSGAEFFGDSEFQRLYNKAIESAEALGSYIVDIDLAPFQEAARLLYSGPWVAERLAAIATFAEDKPESIHGVVRDIILSAKSQSAVQVFEGHYRLAEINRQAEAEWDKMDVLLLPTAPTTYKVADVLADPVRLNSNLGTYTNFVNLMDLSALAIPAGFRRDGLPFGVTLIGRAFEEGRLESLGDQLHRANAGSKLGNTSSALFTTPTLPPQANTGGVQIAVVGAHLKGQPLHSQLTERNATFVRTAKTAPGYSFYVLAGTAPAKPGLIFDGRGVGGIEVEIWELGEKEFGSFVALIPAPLGIGTLRLDDVTTVKGFLCEAHAAVGAQDITSYGGWRAWIEKCALTVME